ncbi:hypothetical protein, partial [Cochleicola gelatinilyticus]|uniref:hypothetical protein n=1 Tax=Cochleicola gelatinilyticus TaxID=1763537 RepID=UPI001A7E17D2
GAIVHNGLGMRSAGSGFHFMFKPALSQIFLFCYYFCLSNYQIKRFGGLTKYTFIFESAKSPALRIPVVVASFNH